MCIVEDNNMPGLFTTKHKTTVAHPLHYVTIPNFCAFQPNVVIIQKLLKATITHLCGNDSIAQQFALRLHFQRQYAQDMIAINECAVGCDKDHAVRVAIKSNAQIGLVSFNGGKHSFSISSNMF